MKAVRTSGLSQPERVEEQKRELSHVLGHTISRVLVAISDLISTSLMASSSAKGKAPANGAANLGYELPWYVTLLSCDRRGSHCLGWRSTDHRAWTTWSEMLTLLND